MVVASQPEKRTQETDRLRRSSESHFMINAYELLTAHDDDEDGEEEKKDENARQTASK